MKYFYRPLLKQAFRLSWENKYLWFFGVFAALLGNSSIFNIPFNRWQYIQNHATFLEALKSLYQGGTLTNTVGSNFTSLFSNFSFSTLLGFLALLAVGLFLIWLIVISQTALVSGAYKLQRKAATNFATDFIVGKRNFWQVLGINLAGQILIYAVLIILSLPFFLAFLKTSSQAFETVLIILSFIIFIPVAWIVAVLVFCAFIFSVAKGTSFKQSLVESWYLFKDNWLISIEMAIVLFLINVAGGIILLLGLLVLSVPFILLGLLFFYLQISPLFWLIVFMGVIFLIILIFLFGALLTVFQTTAWVLLFVRLSEGKVYAKVVRLASLIFSNKTEQPTVEL